MQGGRSGNVQRDVLRAAALAGLNEECPEPYAFDAPGSDGIPRKVYCVLPREVLHLLLSKMKLDAVTLPEAKLRALTGLGPLVRRWLAHPDVGLGQELAKHVIPIGTHGDGVQYTTSMRVGGAKSVYVVTWNFLEGAQAQRSRRFVFCVLQKAECCQCGCEGFHTFQGVFAVFAWSMSLLRGRRSPNRRHDGHAWSEHDEQRRMEAGQQLPIAALVQSRGYWG